MDILTSSIDSELRERTIGYGIFATSPRPTWLHPFLLTRQRLFRVTTIARGVQEAPPWNCRVGLLVHLLSGRFGKTSPRIIPIQTNQMKLVQRKCRSTADR